MKLKFDFSLRHKPVSLGEVDYVLPDLCRGEGLLGVVVIAELLALLITVAADGLLPFNWAMLGQISVLALWISLLSALVLCKANPKLVGFPSISSALISYGLILGVTLVSSIGAELLLSYGFGGRRLNFAQVLENVLIAAIPAGVVLRFLFLQQQLRIQQRAELESRIQALQSRIRPHFLFNSMNMIASLIGSDPEKAERVVEDLSDLFRRALTDSQTLVPLREELALSRSYLQLEKLRLGDRLQTVWEIGDYGAGVQIPCLTLQPVLENAVYHGIQMLPDGGKIQISVKRIADRIEINVSNPRNPRMKHNKGSKMAMSNVRHRLEAHFGPSAKLRFEADDTRYVTSISYPVTGA